MTARTAPQRLVDELERASIAYELVEHARTTTAAAEARVLGLGAHEVAKTVVLTTPEGFVRAVLPASAESTSASSARSSALRTSSLQPRRSSSAPIRSSSSALCLR